MSRIAVMGDRDSIYGFAAVGLKPFPVTDSKEAAETLKELSEKDYAVIYITEALAQSLEKEIEHFNSNGRFAIIPIPGISGNTGKAMRSVKRSVERAVGSDIIFGND